MRTRRGLLGAMAATALLATGVIGGTSTAADGESQSKAPKRYCTDNNHGARVCFQPYGDIFYVKDTAKNNYSAMVRFETSYGRVEECLNDLGAGRTIDCNYNLKEGARVKFWAVNLDAPTNTYRFWSTHREVVI